MLFANYTFPDDVRTPNVPDYFKDSKFMNQICKLHNSAHEKTKETLKASRKSGIF